MVVGRDLHSQRDLLAACHNHGLVDLHIPEVHRERLHILAGCYRSRLPGGADIGSCRHEHAPINVVVHQEGVLAACARHEVATSGWV